MQALLEGPRDAIAGLTPFIGIADLRNLACCAQPFFNPFQRGWYFKVHADKICHIALEARWEVSEDDDDFTAQTVAEVHMEASREIKNRVSRIMIRVQYTSYGNRESLGDVTMPVDLFDWIFFAAHVLKRCSINDFGRCGKLLRGIREAARRVDEWHESHHRGLQWRTIVSQDDRSGSSIARPTGTGGTLSHSISTSEGSSAPGSDVESARAERLISAARRVDEWLITASQDGQSRSSSMRPAGTGGALSDRISFSEGSSARGSDVESARADPDGRSSSSASHPGWEMLSSGSRTQQITVQITVQHSTNMPEWLRLLLACVTTLAVVASVVSTARLSVGALDEPDEFVSSLIACMLWFWFIGLLPIYMSARLAVVHMQPGQVGFIQSQVYRAFCVLYSITWTFVYVGEIQCDPDCIRLPHGLRQHRTLL